jgi:hypothetical protein
MPGGHGTLVMPNGAENNGQAVDALPPKPKIKPQEKMKNLHWKKISSSAVPDSFWKEVDDSKIVLDIQELVSLFSAKAALERKIESKGRPHSKSKGPITFVDPRRQQNVGIGLSRFGQQGLSPRDIKRAIQQVDDRVLSHETLCSLEKLLPTPDEKESILSFDGDKARLASVEKFFVEILEVKEVVQRVRAMKEKASFDEVLKEGKEKVKTLGNAIREIKTSVALKEFLGVVLATGNYLNGSTAKGQAHGFQLDTLSKLSNMKTKDNKSNLLRYIIEFMERPSASFHSPRQIYEELKAVKAASKTSISEAKASINRLKAATTLMKRVADKAEPSDALRDVMGPFLDSYAIPSVERLKKQIDDVEADSKTLVSHFGEVGQTAEEVIVCISNFIDCLRDGYEENKREKLLLEKQAAREKRSVMKKQLPPKSGEGLFAAFSKDQKQGNAKDIVDRVRNRQARQSVMLTNARNRQARQSVMLTNRPPAPPKPPPGMSQRFSGGSLGSLVEE